MASIRKRQNKAGQSWSVLFRVNGRQTSETFSTESAAKRFRGMVDAAGGWPEGWTPGTGMPADDAPRELTLDEWAPRAIAARPRASEATRATYLRDYRLHVAAAFGHRPLAGPGAITREEARLWLVQLRTRRAAKTAQNISAMVSSIFAAAMEDGLAERNPFAGLGKSLPKVRAEDMCFLTPTEFALFVDCFHPHYRPVVIFAAHTGLRLGEFTALRVGDIDWTRARLTVTRAWHRQPDGTYLLGEPKTRRSRRVVRLGAEATAAATAAASGASPGDWLFRTRSTVAGHLHHGPFRTQVWAPAVEAAIEAGLGVRPRIHDLRHTHASWLLNAGVDMRIVQARLGHESIQTTVDRYGHLERDADDAAVAALDAMRVKPRLSAVC